MRVSEHMMTNSILRGINDSKTRMNKLQQQISSGKRLHQSSDDPFAFAKSARYKALIEKNDQYLRSINLSMGFVQASQAGIDNLNNLIQEAKEKATQGADDSLAAEDREAIAQEVQGIIDEILTQLNGQFDGEYLYAGTNTSEVFDAQDNIVSPYEFDQSEIPPIFEYFGNNEDINQKFGEHLELAINVNNEDINAQDLLNKLFDLKTDLENSNDGINTHIDIMDGISENLMQVATKMGDIHNRISLTEQQLTMANMNLSSYMSGLEDTDMAEAVLHYNSEEIAYRASLQSSSNIMLTSLMDYIR